MIKKSLLFWVPLLAFPLVLFAEGAVYQVAFVPEGLEEILELVNLAVALLAAFYAVKLAALSQGGSLEKTWNLLALASVFFALLEVNNSLGAFGLVNIAGLGEIFEVAFGITLLVVFIQTRKRLLKQVLGK